MIVKYCSKCAGKPYTTDMDMEKCPRCGSTLGIKTVQEDELEDCEEFSGTSSNYDRDNENDLDIGYANSGDIEEKRQKDISIDAMRSRTSYGRRSVVHSGDSVLRGKIAQYSSSGKEDGNYHRLFFVKLFDAIIYHQRFEDVLHRFKVRVSGSSDVFGNTEYKDVWVNAHGTLSGGVQIAENSDVEVYGKYKNGVFMARKINVIDNGYTTPINFQHSAKAVLYGILAIFAAIFLIYIGTSSEGGFFQNIGSFLKIWLISAVVVTILYFIAIFSKIGIMARMATGKPRKFPWIGVLLISLVIALIIFNSAGIGASVGSALSGILSSAISVIVLLIVLFIVFKLILGLF